MPGTMSDRPNQCPPFMRCFHQIIGIHLLFCLGLLAGCAEQRITRENYTKIGRGMSMAEVKEILGPPTEVKTAEIPMVDTASYTYIHGKNRISLTFFNDMLVAKEANFSE